MNNQNKKNILELINFVSTTKNIDRKVIIEFLRNSIQRIVNSQLDPDAEITLEIKDNELILTNLKKMVIPDEEEYKNDSEIVDIHLTKAREINPNAKIGDTIESQISFDNFSRSLYSKIEQSFRIEIINWEKKRIYEKYQPLIGTVVEAKLEDDFDGKGATFSLEDGTLCYMPSKYQNQRIKLNEKKYHNVTIEEVYENSKSYQVLVSNDSPSKIREILKRDIPEIERGDIQIVSISRIKGERAKISFRKNPKYEGELDVIGCVIGKDGDRIERISQEIGEKIDAILYSDNINEYIANSLSPAKIVSINKKSGTNDYLVVVPNKHNTIAIGKRGANVKLTVELIRVNIDICSYSYAIENNIPIHWNGNLTKEELDKIDEGFVPSRNNMNNNYQRRNHNNNRTNNWRNHSFSSLVDFEKEIDEYNSEILSYAPVDYSQFTIMNNSSNKSDKEENLHENDDNKFSEIEKQFEEKINDNEIKHINENFKFDKDLVGDIDLSEYDFDDFDDDF
ncbi:MAG: hypothetical protein HDR43_02690 [Mycoplasma sp.]|nr:hypothetical protein [Mycoplasma sp.]